jgi:hypothetical protein
MTTAAIATYAYGQIDQARAERNAVSKYVPTRDETDVGPLVLDLMTYPAG